MAPHLQLGARSHDFGSGSLAGKKKKLHVGESNAAAQSSNRYHEKLKQRPLYIYPFLTPQQITSSPIHPVPPTQSYPNGHGQARHVARGPVGQI